MMKIKKFKDRSEYMSASELVKNILKLSIDKQFLMSSDVDKRNNEAFYYDSGYVTACTDILALVMTENEVKDEENV